MGVYNDDDLFASDSGDDPVIYEQWRRAQIHQEDAKRPEKLYVAEDYKVFFVTRQQQTPEPDRDNRKAYIAVKPFRDFNPEALRQMKSLAETWTEDSSQVRITEKEHTLVFSDLMLKTDSSVPIAVLDEDVRKRLQPQQRSEENSVWSSFQTVASGAHGEDVVAPRKASFGSKPKGTAP